jgi:hypothetical protein
LPALLPPTHQLTRHCCGCCHPQICANLLAQSVGVNVIPWSGSGLTVPDITIPADVVRMRC